MDFSDKMHCSGMGFREYIEALEVERKKIRVFERELPLCLQLVNQTIDRCKQQLSSGTTTTTEYLPGHSECSEQTSSEEHVFEEFIPLKRSSSSDNDHDEDEDEEEEQSPKRKTTEKDINKKADWLKSVQLWNPTPDPVLPQKEELPKKASVMEVKRNGGAFQPFQREKNVEKTNGSTSTSSPAAACTVPPVASAPATSSNSGSGKREEPKEGQTQRKQRRNWSPELHKRFLNALQQLGGSHAAATPKQIRELMKVDGLTNDEVKSHLQKYRLHTRRPTPSIHNNGNAQTPQVVFVGGIWMQPSDYAAAVATAGGPSEPVATSGVYAPVAAPPPGIQHVAVHRPQQNKPSSGASHSDERVMSHSEGGVHSNSPATSSSTHTTTTSPAF